MRALKAVERRRERYYLGVQKMIGRKISRQGLVVSPTRLLLFLPRLIVLLCWVCRVVRAINFRNRSKMHRSRPESNPLFTTSYAIFATFSFFANWLLFNNQQSFDDFELGQPFPYWKALNHDRCILNSGDHTEMYTYFRFSDF